ncbi:hypothetical protein FOA24_29695 [Bacillus thuringiensis]|uniref:hypothetical protein n=1 Tax=Bacillus thuringiensis TaxID=1428 RepID=UPI00333746B8
MIHRYEIKFSVIYNGKKRDLQSVIIPASSLEKANEKLTSEVKRRFGECHVNINSSSICVSENLRYEIHT